MSLSKNLQFVAVIVSIVIASIMIFTIPGYVEGSTNASNSESIATAQQSGGVLFAICGTSLRGNLTLPGMDVSQSLDRVLFDNSSESYTLGNVVFDIMFSDSNSTQLDGPGYDIAVTEIGSPEPFRLSLLGKAGALEYTPTPTQERNQCGDLYLPINAAFIDLDAFDIANDTSIRGLRFDSMGKPGCCDGADIADVYFTNKLSDGDLSIEKVGISNTSRFDQWNVPLMIPLS